MESPTIYYKPGTNIIDYFSDKYPIISDILDFDITNIEDIICDPGKGRYPGITVRDFFKGQIGDVLLAFRGKKLIGLIYIEPINKDLNNGVKINIVCSIEKGIGEFLVNIVKNFTSSLPTKRIILTPIVKKLEPYYERLGFKIIPGSWDMEWVQLGGRKSGIRKSRKVCKKSKRNTRQCRK